MEYLGAVFKAGFGVRDPLSIKAIFKDKNIAMKKRPIIALIVFHSALIFCIACHSKNMDSAQEGFVKNINEKIIIGNDSIFIPIGGQDDSLAYSYEEIKDILQCYPELNNEVVLHPDFTYIKSNSRFACLDSLSKDKCSHFSSEIGRDAYYTLYGYFLQKRFNSEIKLEKSRQKVIEIYQTINELFRILKGGGTYFGHQHRRITGYAEYSIYRLNKYEKELVKQYDIVKQRKIFMDLLIQLIEDEVLIDTGRVGKKEKEKQKRKLYKLTDKLKILITDSFYLNEALEFQYLHY